MSNSGGTLTLPSPTHPHHHHVDVQAGLRSLRRSLSRSPSKFSLVRTASQSSSETGSTPPSPSCRRAHSQFFGSSHNNSIHSPPPNAVHTQSPLATPFRPSVRLSLRSAKSSSKSPAPPSSTTKHSTRHRTSPRSPARRVLSAASNSANSAPSSSSSESLNSGQENVSIFHARSPAPRKSFDKTSNRHSMHLDMTGATSLALSRLLEANNNGSQAPSSVASPLKRSDATMSLDQSLSGSPKAKRRSCGPSTFGADFNIFDYAPPPASPSPEIHDDSAREYDWTTAGPSMNSEAPTSTSPASSVMPRRAGSLRKSTLQQRHGAERTSWNRRQAAQMLSQGSGDATPNAKNRPRLSMDSFMPPPNRDSPFNSQGPLPNPSAHLMHNQLHQPHPLSRTMTTSSSNSSLGDDSPTHFPVPISDKSRGPLNWSKSLPLGSVRPQPERKSHAIASVSTPDYKHARPFEGAFASTGLVSKVNRNPDLSLGGSYSAAVPDTPCKKQVNTFATYPQNPPSGSTKGRGRHIRHAFGLPSTPFNPISAKSQNTFGEQSRPVLFHGFTSRHSRKGSLLSVCSDDGRSPIRNQDEGPNSHTGDISPTPNKHQPLTQNSDSLSHLSNESPTATRHPPAPVSAVRTGAAWRQDVGANCKYSPSNEPHIDGQGGQDVASTGSASGKPDSVVRETRSSTPISLLSFSRSRAKRGGFATPTPLEAVSTTRFKPLTRVRFTKNKSVNAASPVDRLDFADSTTPRTPLEAMAPPDASRLSISNPNDGFLMPGSSERTSNIPPATPTTRLDGMPFFADRRAITPIHKEAFRDLDESLVSRFSKVEFIGRGEFSQVYKVTEVMHSTKVHGGFFSTPTRHMPRSPPSDRVFAVKKLAVPIQGEKDRAIRRREVGVLDRLRGCDHILQLVNSWEENNCLYIQTEFCEEGNLDSFLSTVGLRDRLDDFRIWKVMLEISRGLNHIHEAGYVHLDLKPANILVTFEGSLKIGDFGLATSLAARRAPDLEGDRQYLAPEALRSEVDTPADMFSLGLIMLEIAANVKLPENGATWTALREGDFSEVPTLTRDSTAILRDATGIPIEGSERSIGVSREDTDGITSGRRIYNFRHANRQSGDIFGLSRKSELQQPPEFMCNPNHRSSLDVVVRAMLAAEPMYRPTVSQILGLEATNWVATRHRAGATVFEGIWGPADEQIDPVSLDTEMTDV